MLKSIKKSLMISSIILLCSNQAYAWDVHWDGGTTAKDKFECKNSTRIITNVNGKLPSIPKNLPGWNHTIHSSLTYPTMSKLNLGNGKIQRVKERKDYGQNVDRNQPSCYNVYSFYGNVNAIGYNIKDNFMYGYSTSPRQLVKIDKNFNMTIMRVTGGSLVGMNTYTLGDVSSSGVYYAGRTTASTPGDGINYLAYIDQFGLNTANNTAPFKGRKCLIYPSGTNHIKTGDFAFNPKDPNCLYMTNAVDGYLYKVNVSSKKVTKLGYTGGKYFSRMTFFDKEGNFYFIYGQNVYRIKDAKNATTSTKAKPELVSTMKPTVSYELADGARCPNAGVISPKKKAELKVSDVIVTEGDCRETTRVTVDIENLKLEGTKDVENVKINYTLKTDSADKNDFIVKNGSFTMKDDLYKLNLDVVKGDCDVEKDEVFYINFTTSSKDAIFKDPQSKVIIKNDDYSLHISAFTKPYKDGFNGDITTQVVDKPFDLHIIAFDDKDGKNHIIKDVKFTKIELIEDDKVIRTLFNSTSKPLNAPKGQVDFKTSISSAYKDVKVKVYGIYKNNSTFKGKPFVSYSHDNFAVRPDKFIISTPNVKEYKAGDTYKVDIYAYGNNGKPIPNYNEIKNDKKQVNGSFMIDATALDLGCGYTPKDLMFKQTKFTSGKFLGDMKYDNIGTINLKIQEVNGKEFALVDAKDTKKRFITPASKDMKFVPSKFKIYAESKGLHNTRNYAYYSDDISNAPYVDIRVIAKTDDDTTLTNYSKTCQAKDIDLNVNLGLKPGLSSDIITISTRQRSDNNTLKDNRFAGNNKYITSRKCAIKKDDFANGVASTKLRVTLKKSTSLAKNPVLVSIPKISATDTNQVTTDTIFTDVNIKFQDMRAYIQDPISVIGKKEVDIGVHYETYYSSVSDVPSENNGERSLSGDGNWYIVNPTTDLMGKMDYMAKAPLYTDRITVNRVDRTKVHVETEKFPERNVVILGVKPEFSINSTNTIKTNISFIPDSVNWAGDGKTGMTVDTQVARRSAFKKMGW